jgi:hypothetical protein
MPNPKKLLASAAIAAGLLAGGVTGVILGVPGVSGAQTTTVPNSPDTIAPDTGQTNPDRPPRADGANCPDKAGTGTPAPATGATGTNLGFRRV